MTTLVIDARFYGPEHTGLGRYTMNIMAYLPAHLKDVRLKILLRDPYYTSLTLPPNCQKVRCNLAHYSLAEQLFLPQLLRDLDADLFVAFHFNTPIFSQVPTVVTVHDLIKSFFTGAETTTRSPWLYQLKRWGYNLVVKKTLQKACAVIVPTNTVKNDILALYPDVKPERIHPIPEAPDPIFVQNSKFKILNSKLPTNYILFVGNAYPHKNLALLLKAVTALPQAELVIVAKATPFLSRLLDPLPQAVKTRIHVFSQLTDPELVAVYRQARVLVTPSLMEGYGLVGLEALMVGTPVLASDIPVYREVYGDRVTYIDPHDAPDLARKLRQILRSPKKPKLLKSPKSRTWSDVAQSFAEVVHASCAGL